MTFLELFAGIGGFRRGLEPLGFKCVGWVEMDKFARQSYEAIWPEARGEWNARDITEVSANELPKADIWTFGFPCQDLSVAGKRLGFEGNRSSLFYIVMDLLRRSEEGNRPEWIIAENVMGFLSINKGYDFLAAQVAMADAGYDVEYEVFNARDFGIPQNRRRVFLVGSARSGCGRKVFPLRVDGVKSTPELQEITQGVADAFRVYDPRGVARNLKSESGGTGGGKTGLYAVIKDRGEWKERSEVSMCIDNNYWKGVDNHGQRTMVVKGERVRRLTPRETWRAFGREDWEHDAAEKSGVSDTQRYKQSGNSLVPKIVEEIGKSILREQRGVSE